MVVHCPECGFVSSDGANYCQKCGAHLAISESDVESQTSSWRIDETGEFQEVHLDDAATGKGVLVIRSGGGREGETFLVKDDKVTIGRRSDSGIFLDDVTVSRDHAVIVKRRGEVYIDDCGSLNGTYVNRKRVDSHLLKEGDELQIGKYRLTFLLH